MDMHRSSRSSSSQSPWIMDSKPTGQQNNPQNNPVKPSGNLGGHKLSESLPGTRNSSKHPWTMGRTNNELQEIKETKDIHKKEKNDCFLETKFAQGASQEKPSSLIEDSLELHTSSPLSDISEITVENARMSPPSSLIEGRVELHPPAPLIDISDTASKAAEDLSQLTASTHHATTPQPLSKRLRELLNESDLLKNEIKYQSTNLQKTATLLEQARTNLTKELNEQYPSTSQLRKDQNREHLISEIEDLEKRVTKETAKLTSLEQRNTCCEKQVELINKVDPAISLSQKRLDSLKTAHQALASNNDKRLARATRALQEADTLLQNITTTTLSITSESNPQVALHRIEQEDSLTQLGKANRALELAQSAIEAIMQSQKL